MKNSEYFAEMKALAAGYDKANAARTKAVVQTVKTGVDRLDDNSRKRSLATIKGIECHEKRSQDRASRICDTVASESEKTRKHIDRVTGVEPLSFGQWLGCVFIALISGILGFWFFLTGAKNGIFLCSTHWETVRDSAGNWLDKVPTYEPWMVAIWIFAVAVFIVGFCISYGCMSNYNANHGERSRR